MSIYFCGGSCIEDVTHTHLMNHLSPIDNPYFVVLILSSRAIKELTQGNISYTSDTGKNYDFNTADTLITLLLYVFCIGQLKRRMLIDVDFDHQFIETEKKYDAKPTYKKFGYRPGVVIDDLIVGIGE